MIIGVLDCLWQGEGNRLFLIAVERGKYSPSLESAFRISRVFKCGVEDVFGWEG